VASARREVAAAHPLDFDRFAAEIDAMVAGFTIENQIKPGMWETAYRQVKGIHADELITEARQKRDTPVERSTPKGGDPPQPRKLSDEELHVASKFGKTAEEYRAASDRYETMDGRLPLTVDTKKSARKKAS
jgi:hypothetical protein